MFSTAIKENKPTVAKEASSTNFIAYLLGCFVCEAAKPKNAVAPDHKVEQEEKSVALYDGFTVPLCKSITASVQLGEKIGEGTFGVVHKACWQGVTIAVKQLHLFKPEYIKMFRMEAGKMRVLQDLNVTCIANLRGYYENEKTQCYQILMDYEPGQSLFDMADDYYKDGKAIPLTVATEVMVQVAGACEQFAKHRIVHGDLKLENMLWTAKRTLKIIDWGFALNLGDQPYYQVPDRGGTVRYTAKEVFTAAQFSLFSDVYAVGIITCVFANGGFPHGDRTSPQITELVKNGILHSLPRQCDPGFAKLITQCWNQEPTQRPTMAALHAEFKEIHEASIKPKM